MDGNGRWAKKRMQPRVFGHKAGDGALQEVTIAAKNMGVQVLTVYAFSTENWTRPEDELKFIMHLPVEFYDHSSPNCIATMSRFKMIGDTKKLPKETLEALERAEAMTHLNYRLDPEFRTQLWWTC